jgi:hypothetical protein
MHCLSGKNVSISVDLTKKFLMEIYTTLRVLTRPIMQELRAQRLNTKRNMVYVTLCLS